MKNGPSPAKLQSLFYCRQELAVMSAHLVTMETPGKWAESVSLVSATTTLTCWTRIPATPKLASVCSACITVKAQPARAASWVTMATLHCKTAGVSTLGYHDNHH